MRFLTLAAFAALPLAVAAQSAVQISPQTPSQPATPTSSSQIHLIPMPRQVDFKGDQPITGVNIECPNCNAEDQFAADDLRDTLAARGVPTGSGLRIVFHRLAHHHDSSFTNAMRSEGYTIAYANGRLTLTGATAPGVFYAAQTAKQMIARQLDGSFILQAADIHDWPAMRYRGLSDDLSRGPIDTLAFQKKIVRTLAAYKDNLYSPYFEHTQQYVSNPLPAPPGGSMSASDARELVAYAAKYHVMIVPDQESFGHLHRMLVYDEYQPLAETPHGTVLAPGQPGSLVVIKQMFTELAALYPSPFLHIGADETFELGAGQTKAAVDAQGLGPVYLDFMQQIDNTLRPLNRKLLFWGDIAEKSPKLLKGMPESFKRNTIAISWHYAPSDKGFTRYLNYFKSAGFEFWVSPGINNWSRVYPNYNMGLQNIQEFTRDGQAMGATGQLNTIWYDDGEALAANNWYGILFGCAAAWQKGASSIPQFQANYGPVFQGDLTGKLDAAQQELMAAHDVLKYDAHLGDGSDALFWIDPWSHQGLQDAQSLRPYAHELRMHAERAMDLIAQARAAYPPTQTATNPGAPSSATNPGAPRLDSETWASTANHEGSLDPRYLLPSNPTSLREPTAIDALELGARRLDFIGMKFQLADEMATDYAAAQTAALSTDPHMRHQVYQQFGDINNRVDGRLRDIKDSYGLFRDLYSQLWLRTNRPYSLRPVLARYDYTMGIWLSRIDKFNEVEHEWGATHVLPAGGGIGIPAPPPPSPATAPAPATPGAATPSASTPPPSK